MMSNQAKLDVTACFPNPVFMVGTSFLIVFFNDISPKCIEFRDIIYRFIEIAGR